MRALEMQQENDEDDLLELLLENDILPMPTAGIVKQMLSKGRESLSEKQGFYIRRDVDKYIHLECDHCHIPMPTNEVLDALNEGDDLCSRCRYMREKYF
jgi:hypothetical protein